MYYERAVPPTCFHVGLDENKMEDNQDREFPRPRSGSVMFVYNHQLFLWGGMTTIILGEGDDRFLVDIDLPGRNGNGQH